MDEQRQKASVAVYVSIIYNILEAFFSVVFGLLANSIALTGFGLGSVVESLSGFVLLWRVNRSKQLSKNESERLRQKPTGLIAIIFFILGSYVFYKSVKILMLKEIPAPSLPGMFIALLSLVIMPLLTVWNSKTGNDRNLVSDLKDISAYLILSSGLLIGLSLNYYCGFWQGDPIIGLITVLFLFKRSLEGFLGKGENAIELENNQEESE